MSTTSSVARAVCGGAVSSNRSEEKLGATPLTPRFHVPAAALPDVTTRRVAPPIVFLVRKSLAAGSRMIWTQSLKKYGRGIPSFIVQVGRGTRSPRSVAVATGPSPSSFMKTSALENGIVLMKNPYRYPGVLG